MERLLWVCHGISSCWGMVIDSITMLSAKRFSIPSAPLAMIGVLAIGEAGRRGVRPGESNGDP